MNKVFLHKDPFWAHDPWNGPGVEPGPGIESSDLIVNHYLGADALSGDIDLLPVGLNVYGSYIDNFGGWNELDARFGKSNAFLVSITIFGGRARCADVEPGAMVASALPHWLDNVTIKDEFLPWVYTSASDFAEVNRWIGNRKVIRWSAHYGHGPHICGPTTCGFPQADWTQWAPLGEHGENIDRSIGLILPKPPGPPKPVLEYQRFVDETFDLRGEQINERATVELYDRLRAITLRDSKQNAELAITKVHLMWLAERVYYVAHQSLDHRGRPTWSEFYRGWRYQQLIQRAHGKRFD